MKILGRIFLAITIGIYSSWAFGKKQTNIDFDDLPQGEQLTTQFAQLGVVFEGTFNGAFTSGLIGGEGDFGTFNFGNSEPNFVVVGVGALTAKFLDPTSLLPQPVRDVTFRVGDGDLAVEALGVTVFDVGGTVLDSHIVHLFDKGATINLPYSDIFEIRIFGISGCVGCFSGFAIDDLSFSN